MYEEKSKAVLNRMATRKMEEINKSEKKWKIYTNITKSTTLTITQRTNKEFSIDDRLIELKTKAIFWNLFVVYMSTTNTSKKKQTR